MGLRIGHGPAEMTRAVLEGVAFALAEGLDLMRGLGVEPTAGVVAGGGVNRLWQQIIADVLNMPVTLGATEHASARGAALLGAVAVGMVPSSAQGDAAAPGRHPRHGADPGQRRPLRRHRPPIASSTAGCPGRDAAGRRRRPRVNRIVAGEVGRGLLPRQPR